MRYETYLPFLLMLSLVACCIEVDMSVPSFPDLGRYFAVSDAAIQMTVALNFLGFCIAAFLYGPLSDAYGRRSVMLWGTLFMLVGAVGCTFATSLPMLYVCRILQGIGAASGPVVAFAIIADVYQGEKSAHIIGNMNAFLTTMTAIAPVAGAYVNLSIGWRGNYGVVALVTLFAFVTLFLYLRETQTERQPMHGKQILKDFIRIHRHPLFLIASLAPSLMCAGYFAFIAAASFLYLEVFHLSLTQYALYQCVIIATFSFVSMMSGRILSKLGAHKMLQLAVALCISSNIALVILGYQTHQSAYVFTFLMSLSATGFALIYPVIFSYSLEIFPEIKGIVSSALMSLRSLLCALGVAITSMLYQQTLISLVIPMFCINMLGIAAVFYLMHQRVLNAHTSEQNVVH